MRIGIICGMLAEAKALGSWRHAHGIIIGVSGARPDRAEALALEAAQKGAKILISWGLAGGLNPALHSGDLIQPTTVVRPDGTRETFGSAGIPGPVIAGSDEVVTTPQAKAEMYAATGADAVDMETHRVADVANVVGVDLAVIRAISDPADRALPPLVTDALGPDGRPKIGRILLELSRVPSDLPGLIGAKLDSDRGLATLYRASHQILPDIVQRYTDERVLPT